ncbi:hypothetical protein RHGRI_005442 [Rhododendron griersonianum]|uniref:Transmembrane protein n=1 Tax=Rhododendron griersonianum TaxID=479676 RepID=A0AAV6LEH6_9ERIC|nr:hypothetical protein RHGRI_005442 [Rhododendron griersonianum]
MAHTIINIVKKTMHAFCQIFLNLLFRNIVLKIMANSNASIEIELHAATPTTPNAATPTTPNAGDELNWKKLSEYRTIIENLSGRSISSLQMSAFTLVNYFVVSQAVVFTALSRNSSLVCRDVWLPLFFSLLPGALNLFAFYKIGHEYIETKISLNEYKGLKRDHEVCMAGLTMTPILDDEGNEIAEKIEKKEKGRLTVILYSCMFAVGFLAAVTAVGSLWMLCGESIMRYV